MLIYIQQVHPTIKSLAVNTILQLRQQGSREMDDSRARAEKIQHESGVCLQKGRKAKEEKGGHDKMAWLPMAKDETIWATKQSQHLIITKKYIYIPMSL